jgi:hypothetical protein
MISDIDEKAAQSRFFFTQLSARAHRFNHPQ